MIISWAPGSATDLGSRVVAEKMGEFLGQPMVSVFKTGGGGAVGTDYVAGSKPDGYTLLVGSESNLVVQPILKKLTYDLDSFIYIGGYSRVPFFFSVRSDGPWKTLQDFITEAKKSPKKFKVGIPGVFTTTHVAWELLCQKAGIETVAIPFQSTGEVLTALMGEHVDVAATSGAGGMGQSGTIRVIAVTEKQRLSNFPDVPTLDELKYPLVLDSASFSFGAPKGTPKEIVEILYKAQEKAFSKYGEEIKQKLARVEQTPFFVSGEEYYRTLKERQKIFFAIGKTLNVLPK
jgi:tripartite-type tricarboxylate transporter receptor subunit TctC